MLRRLRRPRGLALAPVLTALLVAWVVLCPAGGSVAQEPPAAGTDAEARGEQAGAGESLREAARSQDPRFEGAREVPIAEAARIPLGPPILTTADGPLFPLGRIVDRLGGRLVELEGSVTLVLGGVEVIGGSGNPVMLVDREVVELSQAPRSEVSEDQGLLVPLDFLRASYGRLTDFRLRWSPEERELVALRREPRVLPVTVDVVHLQGASTVVLHFPERPDYRVVEQGGDVEVVVERDRLAPATSSRVRDPLVREVEVGPDRVRLDLVRGARADSYTLSDPFRLVFDVVEGGGEPAVAADRAGGVPDLPPRPQPPEGLATIVIDPGHGGLESGAVGPSGLLEKDLTLELARELRDALRRRLPVKVVLTRDGDAHLPLDTRSAIANQNKADLFVSIHLNSSLGRGARGAETYFLSMEASDERAEQTAALENAVLGEDPGDEALYDLQLILWDLSQSYHLAASQRVATLIQEELNTALSLRDRGVKQAPFRVLMGAAMPAVLVELGFLSNPEEETRLQDPAYQAELVNALVRAISRYRAEIEERRGRLEAAGGGTPAPGKPSR